MSEKGVFRHDKEETVLCYHGPLVYEAKVQDRVAREGPDSSKIKLYLVHYQGWNTHWDEWVPESRVLKHNAENLQLQKDRIKEFQRAHKRKKLDMSASPASSAAGAGGAPKKRKAGDDDSAIMTNDIKEQLRLPQSMKLKLIEDWERITREKKLVPVPRTPSIATLLDHFVQAKAKRTSHERLYGEVSDGMKTFFNQSIGTVLLYKYERKQFREMRESHRNTPYVELYGAEHLLRLFKTGQARFHEHLMSRLAATLSRNADILKSLRVIKKLPEQILQIHSVIYALCLSSAEWQLQNCTILMRKNRKIYVPEFGCGPTVGLRSHYAAPRGLVCLFIDPNPLWQIHRKPMMHKGLC